MPDTTPSERRFLVLAPMRSELRSVVRAFGLRRSGHPTEYRGTLGGGDVAAALIGVGPAAAAATTAALLERHPDVHVVVSGIAGGIDPEAPVGTTVVPETVVDLGSGEVRRPAPLGGLAQSGRLATTADFVTAEHDLALLRSQGVVAVDMESAAVGAVCDERGVPWSVFRCISDRPHDGLADDAVFGLLRPDGSADAAAVLRLVLRRPGRVPDLVRLGRDSAMAAGRAARLAALACEGAEPTD
ncbi:MAG: 5'-methylthioadenosine/S-adenosylhomocysteine nucleosidase family protein [Acidimicrobiales bacterium]